MGPSTVVTTMRTINAVENTVVDKAPAKAVVRIMAL